MGEKLHFYTCVCVCVCVLSKIIYIISKNRMTEIRPPIQNLLILCIHRLKKHYCLANVQKAPCLFTQIASGPQFKLDYVKMGIFALCTWEVSQAWLDVKLQCGFPHFLFLSFWILSHFCFCLTVFSKTLTSICCMYLMCYIVLRRVVLEKEQVFIFLDNSQKSPKKDFEQTVCPRIGHSDWIWGGVASQLWICARIRATGFRPIQTAMRSPILPKDSLKAKILRGNHFHYRVFVSNPSFDAFSLCSWGRHWPSLVPHWLNRDNTK